jgi:hypothetical protein
MRLIRFGTSCKSFSNTLYSLLALHSKVVREQRMNDDTESTVTYSSSSSSSSTSPPDSLRRCKPFMINAWTLHIACTVLPKCRPWWINGSAARLSRDAAKSDPQGWQKKREGATNGDFLLASLRLAVGVALAATGLTGPMVLAGVALAGAVELMSMALVGLVEED